MIYDAITPIPVTVYFDATRYFIVIVQNLSLTSKIVSHSVRRLYYVNKGPLAQLVRARS